MQSNRNLNSIHHTIITHSTVNCIEDVTDIHCYDIFHIIQCYTVSSLVFCLLGPEIDDASVLELDAHGMNLILSCVIPR